LRRVEGSWQRLKCRGNWTECKCTVWGETRQATHQEGAKVGGNDELSQQIEGVQGYVRQPSESAQLNEMTEIHLMAHDLFVLLTGQISQEPQPHTPNSTDLCCAFVNCIPPTGQISVPQARILDWSNLKARILD
jgi:hypothetical protein